MAPLLSWRNFVGLQAVLRGAAGLVAPTQLMKLAHVAVLPDITTFMVRYMSLTSVALGCRIMYGPDDTAVGAGLFWFGGWSLLLTKAILEGTASGPVVTAILEWHGGMSCVLLRFLSEC